MRFRTATVPVIDEDGEPALAWTHVKEDGSITHRMITTFLWDNGELEYLAQLPSATEEWLTAVFSPLEAMRIIAKREGEKA